MLNYKALLMAVISKECIGSTKTDRYLWTQCVSICGTQHSAERITACTHLLFHLETVSKLPQQTSYRQVETASLKVLAQVLTLQVTELLNFPKVRNSFNHTSQLYHKYRDRYSGSKLKGLIHYLVLFLHGKMLFT